MSNVSGGTLKRWAVMPARQTVTIMTLFATLASSPWIAGCTGMVNANNKTSESTIQVVPAALDFGSIGVGKKVSQPASVTNTGTSTVTLTHASVSSSEFSISGLKFPVAIQAGQKANFTVWFQGAKPGKTKGKLNFGSDAGTPAPNPVDLTATVENPTPRLDISAASYDFGKVTINTVATGTLTLTNSGGANLNISKISVTGVTFAATGINLPAVLPAKGSATLNLTFSPKTAGNYSGTVAVASDDPDSPIEHVNLTAVATTELVGRLSATPATLSFTSVKVGSSASAVATIKNTGTANVTFSQIRSSSTAFSTSGIGVPVLMVPGESLALTVKFNPTSAGTSSGNISLVNSQGGITAISTLGTAVAAAQSSLTVSPGTISFGNVVANLTNTQTVQLANPSTVSVTITAVNVTGTGFSTSGLHLPLTLNAGQSSSFNVQFNPKAAGSLSGTLALVSDAANPPSTVALSGTGIAATLTLSVNPTNVHFASVTVNNTASRNIIVMNSGNSDVAISNISLTGAKFSLTGGSAVTLAPSQSITLAVQFAPSAAGAATGSVSIVSNATGSPASIPVSGTGVSQVHHTVLLAWNASAASAGYNVYRSSSSGAGYLRLNSSLNTALSYSDATVQSGQTYFYVTTAVDSAGHESVFSAEASANIP